MAKKGKPISTTELVKSLLVISEAAKSLAMELLLDHDEKDDTDSGGETYAT